MERAPINTDGGEQVYVITTLGMSAEGVDHMQRAARFAKTHEYLQRHYEGLNETLGQTIDTSL